MRAVLGDIVFGVDDETMEAAVGRLLEAQGLTLAVAESLTGGLVCVAARERARARASGSAAAWSPTTAR